MNVISRTGTHLIDQHLEACMQIATLEIKYKIERLIKGRLCQTFHTELILLKKILIGEPSCP
jgi:hypothetical protein